MNMESVFASSGARVGLGVGASPLLRPRLAPQSPIALELSVAADKVRFKKNVINSKLRGRWQAVSASKSNLPDGDSVKGYSNGVKSGDAPQGPPFLTILAGFLVLLLVFWIIASILMWFISFFVTSPPPN